MHFVVAVFANKDQLFDEESFERFSKIERGEGDDSFKELHTKLSKRMEDLVYNKSLKYVESGVDEEWDQWLKDNNGAILIVAIGRTGEDVRIENFAQQDGLRVPAGWNIGYRLVEVKPNGANRTV